MWHSAQNAALGLQQEQSHQQHQQYAGPEDKHGPHAYSKRLGASLFLPCPVLSESHSAPLPVLYIGGRGLPLEGDIFSSSSRQYIRTLSDDRMLNDSSPMLSLESCDGDGADAAPQATQPSERPSSSPNGTSSCDSSSESLRKQLVSIEGVHAVFGSPQLRLRAAPEVPNPKLMAAVAGSGLAPWEIHRPQRFVRDLVLRRCFSGRVLDAGCGIGDNALYIAKACPAAEVVAVDKVRRCLDFADTKAGLRGMRGRLELIAADLCDEPEPEGASQPYTSPVQQRAPYDIVLDSSTFHGFPDGDRRRYVATLGRLLRPGGVVYMSCMSEEETQPGGPRRVSPRQLGEVFNPSAGWLVEGVEESFIELHPTFWGGKAKARVFTIRKLWRAGRLSCHHRRRHTPLHHPQAVTRWPIVVPSPAAAHTPSPPASSDALADCRAITGGGTHPFTTRKLGPAHGGQKARSRVTALG